jgi:hypothetical protein
MPIAPVGATTIGNLDGAPRISVEQSTFATSRSTRGAKRSCSKAARLARSVSSSSAPPSKKSNTIFGKRRRASARRSSMLAIRDRFMRARVYRGRI